MTGLRHIRGLTLIELLVVVAIIGLLVAMVVPALGRAKKAAHRMVCASNMKQLFLAARMYADDRDGWLPARGMGGADRWPALFRRFVGNNVKIYYCPLSLGDPETLLDPFANNHNNTSYIINGFNDVITYNTPAAMSLDWMHDLPDVILFGESKKNDGNYYMDLVEGNLNLALDDSRHNAGSNYAFVDGHAEWIAAPRTVAEKMWQINKSYTLPPGGSPSPVRPTCQSPLDAVACWR